MANWQLTLRSVALAGFSALALTVLSPTASSAHQVYTQCDSDGDDCWHVICDDDGDDCRIGRHFHRYNAYSPGSWGYFSWGAPTYGYEYPRWRHEEEEEHEWRERQEEHEEHEEHEHEEH